MKAYEETWFEHPTIPGLVVTANMDDVLKAANALDYHEAARIRLASAAPDMARALLMWLPDGGHTLECANHTGRDERCSDECRTTRAALKKAGVL